MGLKKIGVLSDTHLTEVTDSLIRIVEGPFKDMDMIIHAGDVVSTKILDFLSQKELIAVAGNMDPYSLRTSLPSRHNIEINGLKIGIIHGWGPATDLPQRISKEFQDMDLIIFGHSHSPYNVRLNKTLLFNPGTATGWSPTGLHTVGIIEIDQEIKAHILEV